MSGELGNEGVCWVHSTAQIAPDVVMGAFCVVEAGVQIGAGTVLGHGVVLHRGTVVGQSVRIDDHAALGKEPLCSPRSATTRPQVLPPAQVGDGCLIGSGAVVYRGAVLEDEVLLGDNASVRENCHIGRGTILGRLVSVENRVSVGARCKVQTAATLCAYTVVEADCFIGPGVVTANDPAIGRGADRQKNYRGLTLRRGARLAAGVVTLPGITLEQEAVAGAGSVITHSVPAFEVHLGAPARYHRMTPREQCLAEGNEDVPK